MPFSLSEIYSFVGIVVLLVMFPGPNTVLVMQSVCTKGRKAGFCNVLGVVTAVYFNALLSGLGLSLIVLKSAEVYNLLKLLGGGYIVYLGLISLVEAYRLHRLDPKVYFGPRSREHDANHPSPKNSLACYSQGLLSGILNPKSAIFFLAFFPQFIHRQGNIMISSLILTVIYSLVSVAWYSLLVLFIGSMHQFIMAQGVQKWLKTVTGTILIGMGIKIVAQK